MTDNALPEAMHDEDSCSVVYWRASEPDDDRVHLIPDRLIDADARKNLERMGGQFSSELRRKDRTIDAFRWWWCRTADPKHGPTCGPWCEAAFHGIWFCYGTDIYSRDICNTNAAHIYITGSF